jgi:Arc/MetJ-type ribon-helix-helix transcriptional regulator
VLAIVNILLTPEQAEIIQQKLQSGRYQNVDDAITDRWRSLSVRRKPKPRVYLLLGITLVVDGI